MTENQNNDPENASHHDHEAGSDGPDAGLAQPGEEATAAPAASPGRRFRDRAFGLRAMIGVGLAGLVLGGLGGAGIGAVANHGDRDGRGGHTRGFDQRSGDGADGQFRGRPGGPRGGAPQAPGQR